MTSARLRSLRWQPSDPWFPPRRQPLRPRSGRPSPQQLGQVDAEGLADGVEADEGRARRITPLQRREGAHADPRRVREALLVRVRGTPAFAQVVADPPEQFGVSHPDSRRLLAIVFQAMGCLY
jgi:hypothetical protein